MSSRLKKYVSSLLLAAVWLVPTAQGFAAQLPDAGLPPDPTRPLPLPQETRPKAPRPPSFAELFPFGALAGAVSVEEPRGSSESTALSGFAERERQATNLQDFRGGGVSVYIGSTALLIVIIVLLIILL